MKQAIEQLFVGIDGLPAGFADKAITIFEAAVLEAVGVKVAESTQLISESADGKVAAAITEADEKIRETLDVYLSEAVTEWAAENAVPLDNKIKAEVAESFLTGLHTLFEANNVVITEATEASADALAAELATTKTALTEAEDKLKTISEEAEKATRAGILATALEGVVATSAERITKIIESMTFTDTEDYRKKVGYVVEGMKPAKEAGAADMGDDGKGKDGKDGKDGKPPAKDGEPKLDKDGNVIEEGHQTPAPDAHMESILEFMKPKKR